MKSILKISKFMLLPLITIGAIFAVMSCTGGGNAVLNKDKPLVFFNRQPSDPTTGKIDMDSMNWMRFAAFYSLKPTKC